MKKKGRKTNRKRIVLPLLSAIVAVLLLMMSMLIIFDVRRAFSDIAKNANTDQTYEKLRQLELALSLQTDEAEELLARVSFVYAHEEDENAVFAQVTEAGEGIVFDRMYYLLDDGRVYDLSGRRYESADGETERRIAARDAGVGAPERSEDGREVLPVYVVSPEPDARVRGAVVYFYSSAIYANCRFGDEAGRVLYVFDAATGAPVLSPEGAPTADAAALLRGEGISDGEGEALIASLSAGNGVQTFYDEQDEVIVSGGTLALREGWFALTLMPAEALNEYSDRIVEQTVIIVSVMAALLFVMLLSLFISNARISREVEVKEGQDRVTGCNNETRFEKELFRLLEENRGASFALLYLSFVNYKTINQVYGFHCTDEAFCHISGVLERDVRRHETYGRANDGSFLLLLAYRDREELTERFRGFCEQAQRFEQITAAAHRIMLSAGVYCIQEERPPETSELIDRAYYAFLAIGDDRRGGELVFYDDRMKDNLYRVSRIEADVERSLKNGEFCMYLQPKYDLSQRRLYGAEALVRWIHPTEGMIAPGVFIPIFENNGFVREIDRFMIEEVCRYQQRRARARQRVFPISVNVSRVSIEAEDFLDFYVSTKAKYSVPDGFVELEFTERGLLEDYEYLGRLVNRLRENGFPCSIDDFGAGYSSFKALKAIEFDTIKLDVVFLERSVNRERDTALISGAIAMAKALGTTVVAEGVEAPEDYGVLESLGCDVIQGYLYARPLTVEQFGEFIERSREPENKQ